ncbi:twin-arginine translocase TatA/TatE family subunit [Methylocapsa acidiphila]|uniref:twin-arginine translocase TatA/TatE family subunit n=1 Tax=Methylocapsa acidiphila TaxID=133552 RepID=UPI0004047526|nr:twin-arginine translocase TatA/TatE family subunit [Methylocapsa acidiphila]
MGGLSIWHWLIVGGVALLLFGGKGKISDIMGDVAKGIKSFKKGLSEDEDKADPSKGGEAALRSLDHQPGVDSAKAPDARKVG